MKGIKAEPEVDWKAVRAEARRAWWDEMLRFMRQDERTEDLYEAIRKGDMEGAEAVYEVVEADALEVLVRKHPVEFFDFVI